MAAWLLVPLTPIGAEPPQAKSVQLERGAHFYSPAQEGALPLVVLLPGTGGKGEEFLDALKPAADAQGFAILALTPRHGGNFQAIDRFFDDYEAGRPSARADWPKPRFGKDRERMIALLDRLAGEGIIDPARVGLLGFSHGGSYALSLGLAHPERFRTVAALSPGVFVVDAGEGSGPAVFLGHGRADERQPYRRTACAMTARLAALGRPVVFHGFDGGHTMTPTGLGGALMHFLSGGKRPLEDEIEGAREGDCAAD